MKTYLKNLLSEKGLEDQLIEVEGAFGLNIIEMPVLVDAITNAPKHEQESIRKTLVKIDFMNGDVMHFFRHLAKAIAI